MKPSDFICRNGGSGADLLDLDGPAPAGGADFGSFASAAPAVPRAVSLSQAWAVCVRWGGGIPIGILISTPTFAIQAM